MSLFGHDVLPEAVFGRVPLWRQIMRGFSQCAFQANEMTALFMIAAVAVFDLQTAAFYVIGVVVGTLVAKLLKGMPDLLDLGLYGFNSGLMGLAMGAFFAHEPMLWGVVVVMAAMVGAVAVLLSKVLPFPMLAAPFILSFWAMWAVSENLGIHKLPQAPFTDTEVAWGQSIVAALGGALFAGAVLSGVLFFIGVAISNWRHALLAVIGVSIAHWVAYQAQVEPGRINAGLVGFNAVLCTIAVYSMMGQDLRLTLLGAVGATIFIRVFEIMGLIPLAAGFVTMTWLIIFLAWLTPRFNAKSEGPKGPDEEWVAADAGHRDAQVAPLSAPQDPTTSQPTS